MRFEMVKANNKQKRFSKEKKNIRVRYQNIVYMCVDSIPDQIIMRMHHEKKQLPFVASFFLYIYICCTVLQTKYVNSIQMKRIAENNNRFENKWKMKTVHQIQP